MTTVTLPKRLDFMLHDFVRVSWITARAHEVWSPRLQRIARAWPKVELASVALGIRNGALLQLSPEGYLGASHVATQHGISTVLLSNPENTPGADNKPDQSTRNFNVFIGKENSLTDFIAAWNNKAIGDIGAILGYPRCCVKAFTDIWSADGWLDSTWRIISMTQQSATAGLTVDLDAAPLTNIFWRYLGIRNVPHLPCKLDCPETKTMGESFLEAGARAGFPEEMAWLKEVLSWPVEWSALHGIAEIKTPILKLLTRMDATAAKLTVRWHSAAYPAEGGKGVRFPYIVVTPGLVTLSNAYQRGIEHAKITNQTSLSHQAS